MSGVFSLALLADMATEDWTRVYTYTFVGVTFMVYLGIGWWSRVAESQGFYVAGRGVPAIANGAATAADWMSAASFISMSGLISLYGSDGSVYLMGWTGGYVLLALLLAPYLRKFGQYTVPDFVGARYYSEAARIVAAVCAIFVSLTYVAGQMRGVGIVFSRFLEVPIWVGVVVGMVIVAFFAVLGGMKGITWTQVVQFFVLIVAFLIPAVALSSMLTGNPLPQWGLTFSDAATSQAAAAAGGEGAGIAEQLNSAQQELGFSAYTKPFATRSMLDVFCITFALMAGTAGLPHVIVRFYTTPDVRSARFSAGWALLFIAILYTTAPALAVFAKYNILQTLDGAQIASVDRMVTHKDGVIKTNQIPILDEELHTLEEGLRRATEARDNRHALLNDAETQPDVDHIRLIYNLVDDDGEPLRWVSTWQKTGLISLDDADGDGRIQLSAMVEPAAGVEQGEVTLNQPLRYDRLQELAGAKIAGEAPGAGGALILEKDNATLAWAIEAQQAGVFKLADADNNGRIELGPLAEANNRNTLGYSEAKIDHDILVLATPEVAMLPSWVIALVATGGLAAALSTAAGLLLVISSSFAHDLYIHFIDPEAPESRRVMVGRLMICVAIIGAGYFGINPPGFVGEVVAFAFGLAAASFFPIILLGVFDKRANREGAIAGMIVGIVFTAVYIMGCKAEKLIPYVEAPFFEPVWGISPEGVGAVGCLLNFITALVVSRLTPPPPKHVQELVEQVRTPGGAHEPEASYDERDAEADNP